MAQPRRQLTFGKWLVFTLLVLSSSSDVLGQTSVVRGFITDYENGEPLEGVNVVLRGDSFHGTVSDRDGVYVVANVPPGDYVFQASYIGYVPYVDTLSMAPGITVTLGFALHPDRTLLDEIVVEDERAGAANVVAGQQTIRPRDLELIPAPDVSGDLANYLTALPGVVSTGDRGGQLFVRGGEPTQNLVLLDGIPVYQPFHIVGFYSAFPSDVISRAEFFAGGFGSEFGGRLSSVLDVSTRNGNKQAVAGNISIAPFVSSAMIEGPLRTGSVSFLASVRESVVNNGAERLISQELPYRFGDRIAKFHAKVSNQSTIGITALSTYDRARVGLDVQDAIIDSLRTTDIVWENRAAGLRYVMLPSALPMLAVLNLNMSQLRSHSGPAGFRPDREVDVTQYTFSADVSYSIGQHNYDWGIFGNTYVLDSELGGLYQNIDFSKEYVTEVGGYVKADLYIGSGLKVTPGLRLQAFPSKAKTFYEPRLRAVWIRGQNRFSMAGGQYHQEVIGLNDRRDIGNVFTSWTSSPRSSVPEAWHVMAGWQREVTAFVDFSVEGYYKDLSGLYIAEWSALPRFTTNLQTADGTSAGGDVRLEIDRKKVYSLISYGYSVTEYGVETLSGSQLVDLDFSPPHDRRHQLTVLTRLESRLADVTVQWKFGSGLPFNQVLGFDNFVFMDGPVDLFEEIAIPRVLYDSPYAGRLPAYHRLDVAVERVFTLSPGARMIVNVGMINTYDRENLFYYDLFTLGRANQLPFVPSVGIKLEVGH